MVGAKLRLTRRQFLKAAALGTCGAALGYGMLERLMDATPSEAVKTGAGDGIGHIVEAAHYRMTGGDAACGLCPHGCVLGEGETGVCRVRRSLDRPIHGR